MRLKLIFFPLTLIVSVAIFIWVAKPEWESLKANKQMLVQLTEKRDKLQSNEQNMKKARDQYDALEEEDRQLIMNALPSFYNNDDFVAEIYKNVQGSGVYLISTDLKEGKNNEDAAAQKRCLEQNAKVASIATDDVDVVAEPAYCPPAKKAINTTTKSVGAYSNVKDFVKRIDTQNRLAVPSKLILEKLTSGNSMEGVQVDNNMIMATATFDCFSKEQDKKVLLSSLIDGNDKVLASLMQGTINSQAIQTYKDAITSEMFRPVTVENMGKADIFAQ